MVDFSKIKNAVLWIMTKDGQKEWPKNYYQKRLAIRPYINDIICFMRIPGHSGHRFRIKAATHSG
jgi:hypothetical protein